MDYVQLCPLRIELVRLLIPPPKKKWFAPQLPPSPQKMKPGATTDSGQRTSWWVSCLPFVVDFRVRYNP